MKDKGKLLILFLAGSEAFFFAALIIAYIYYRNFQDLTDTVSAHLNVVQASILTLCLLASSFTLIQGRRNLVKRDLRKFRIFSGITLLLGLIFIAGQIKEFSDLYNQQITLNLDIFSTSFFTLTGFHGLHVIIGLATIALLLGFSFGHQIPLTMAGISGLEVYWHFVDVVWLVVFFFVYIKPLLL